MKLWCRIAGHDWRHVGETFTGFETRPHTLIWKCSRCKVEQETGMWMIPQRGGWLP